MYQINLVLTVAECLHDGHHLVLLYWNHDQIVITLCQLYYSDHTLLYTDLLQ